MASQRSQSSTVISSFLSLLLFACSIVASCPSYLEVKSNLSKLLSDGSSVESTTVHAPRWSQYKAPNAAYLVNVASENDVSVTIKYCNQHNITFFVQNGGNGWADTFNLGQCSLIIDIGGLRQISFNTQKTEATIQGGVRVQEMVNAAFENGTRFANPTCNCLGFLGAILGGGLTRMSGLYGWGVDQILSVNMTLASGNHVQVSNSSYQDLFWAIRGAAANFGVITSAVIKAYPVQVTQNVAWQGPLIFSEENLENLVQAVNDLDLEPQMQIDFLISTSGPPSYTPVITATPIFLGNKSAARKAFSSILDIGPISNNATEIPYTEWSGFSDGFCSKGDRKPAYGASTANLDPKAWRSIYDLFKAFVATDPVAFGNSSILAENYPVKKAEAIGSATSSYPWRNLSHHIVAIPWYSNASDDAAANTFGNEVRDLLRKQQDDTAPNTTYINFAHGDESLEIIYGDSLPRLRSLKARYDPEHRFSQWFPIKS